MITDLPINHRLFKEELLIPLIAVDEITTLDQTLRKANDTEYGLAASSSAKIQMRYRGSWIEYSLE